MKEVSVPYKKGTWGVLFVFIIIDQASKYIFLHNMVRGHSPMSSATPQALAQTASVVTIVGLLLALRYVKPRTTTIGIIIIIAGGFSNVLDLMTRGFAADIFYVVGVHFNMADIYIVFGSIIVLTKILFTPLTPNEKQ